MDFATFLKQHSTLSNAFIDKFLSLYNPERPYEFAVNLTLATEWLDVEKRLLVRTLKTSYKEGKDFIVVKGQKATKTYLLTSDCFMRLCMRSRSKRAEEVRTYFIQIESLTVRYLHLFKNAQQPKLKK